MVPSPWERRSFLRGMRYGGAVARKISSGNQVRVGQSGATSRTCSSSSLSLHSVCASRLTGGNAYLSKSWGQLCASASVPRGPSVREKYSWRWEDSWEANRFTWASPNWLQISRIVSGWSRHSPGNVSCRESTSAARLSFPGMWTALRDLNCVWLQRRRWRASCDIWCDHISLNRLIYTRGGQPHCTFILRGREPIPQCCDRHPFLRWCTEWNAGRPVGRTSEITREQVRGDVTGGEALTVTLRYPRVPAGGSLLESKKPARVAAEGANPFRKKRRDRSEVMLIRPQQAHESSTNASSACWKPRHWRQQSCPSSAERKRSQPEGHGWNGILKKTRLSMICSFRICSFSWSAQGNRCWEEFRWLHRDTNQEQIRDERLVKISTLLIHLAPKLKSNEWMYLSPFYTRMHGEWLRFAKSSSQFHWRFLLKSEMIGASR